MPRLNLTWGQVMQRAGELMPPILNFMQGKEVCKVYGIPRGGIPAAQALHAASLASNLLIMLVEKPEDADIFIDDLVDSGRTRDRYKELFPDTPFFVLVDKKAEYPAMTPWIEFPWERMSGEQGIEDNVVRLIEYIGDDPNREGLLETPSRVIKSYGDLFSGYHKEPKDVFKIFENDSSDEMVVLRDIEFYSTCEHHMIPFFGKAHIAYIPDGKVIGLSKMARLLEIFTRRLQIQERISQQVTDTMDLYLAPLGSACILEAKHMCMCARGVGKQNSTMVTSSLSGAFRKAEARAELFALINR
jgi:GTP cyclohydrolase I